MAADLVSICKVQCYSKRKFIAKGGGAGESESHVILFATSE